MNDRILRPDAKGRITLGDIASNVSSYKVIIADSGTITLEPYAEIPLSDKWIFDNKELLAKLKIQALQEHN